MNDLEKQLRSWEPRRPSAKLKPRLFAIRPVVAPASHSFSWLAPATAALLVMGMLLNQRRCAMLFDDGKHGPMVAMILTNPGAAACLPASFESQQNGVPADAFHWAHSSPPQPGLGTNLERP